MSEESVGLEAVGYVLPTGKGAFVMHFVFIGPPGAGKGTQCQRLSNDLRIPHLSTGEILRKAKTDQTPLGKAIANGLDGGDYVDDDTMIQLVRERIDQPDCKKGFILDGFPRTIPQAENLPTILGPARELSAVFLLFVDRSVLGQRLAERFAKAETPRPEDHSDAIPKRLEIYETATLPLVDFYRQSCSLHEIDGHGSPDDVYKRVRSALNGLND